MEKLMLRLIITFFYTFFLGIFLVSCTLENGELGFLEETEITSSHNIQDQKMDAEGTGNSGTQLPNSEIEETSNLVEDNQTNDESDCDDPFAGVDIRFRLDDWKTDFCKHSVPLDEIISGGPSRDVIPPIDEPIFESVREADDWLVDQEPVIWLGLNGDVRSYPLQILIWHEIVNDTVGGIPVVVTFCPLCNTALVFQRPIIDGNLLNFGTSGNLRNSDLVMWDRQTESWWQQFTGEAIVGDLTGNQLQLLPSTILSWGDFKTKHPNGHVLSKETGYLRDYGTNPYPGYDNINQFPFLFDGDVDDRLLPMTRVLGVELDGYSKAFVYDTLATKKVINDRLGDKAVVVFWKSGTSSAVDMSSITEGRDVGTTGVYHRRVAEEELTFIANEDGTFRDAETGSTWDILGTAIAGPLQGLELTPLPHYDTFWFVWAAFIPEENIVK